MLLRQWVDSCALDHGCLVWLFLHRRKLKLRAQVPNPLPQPEEQSLLLSLVTWEPLEPERKPGVSSFSGLSSEVPGPQALLLPGPQAPPPRQADKPSHLIACQLEVLEGPQMPEIGDMRWDALLV